MNQRLKDFLIFSFVIAGFFLFVYRNLLGLGALIYGDLSPFYPKATIFIDAYRSSWVNDNLGYPGSSIESAVFNAILQLILGDNPVLAQKYSSIRLHPSLV